MNDIEDLNRRVEGLENNLARALTQISRVVELEADRKIKSMVAPGSLVEKGEDEQLYLVCDDLRIKTNEGSTIIELIRGEEVIMSLVQDCSAGSCTISNVEVKWKFRLL